MRDGASPDYFDPARVGELWVERAGLAAEAGRRYADERRLSPSSHDAPRVCAFGIDCQVGFCTPGASLFVPGAVEDTARTIAWIYAHVGRITELALSLDTHAVFQIFHPSWWADDAGAAPPPFTTIRAQDVRDGRWRALRSPDESLEYVEKLEATGRYTLTVWPFHTLLGGTSHALVPALMEAVVFHAAARGATPRIVTKGSEPLTESYSVLAPEVREVGGRKLGGLDRALVDALMSFDRVYVFGQAKSHCVLSTLRDLATHIEAEAPAAMDKIWILEDATSPVPAPPIDPLAPELDYPRVAERAFAELAERGMRLVKTSDPW